MTPDEITSLIERKARSLPERMTGNEANPLIAEELRPIAISDRPALVEALRRYLSFRVPPQQRQPEDAIPESRMWMALDVTEHLGLYELKPDIELLLAAVRDGKALDRIDAKMVARYLQRLSV